MSKVSVREAAFLTGKSRETINAATKDGILSVSINGRGHKEIDVAELERVYPLIKNMADIEQSAPVRSGQPASSEPSDLKQEVAVLRERAKNLAEQNELMKTERERERYQLEAEIANLRSSLEKAQDQHGQAMRLLTHQREEGGTIPGQDDQIARLEETVAVIKRQNRALYRELKKPKTFWSWLGLSHAEPARKTPTPGAQTG